MKELTAAQVFAADDCRIEKLEIPQWDGFVYVKTLTSADRDQWEEDVVAARGRNENPNARARLAVLAVCDSTGRELFTAKDIDRLAAKSGAALDLILEKARDLNKITDQDLADLEKNSESATTDSPGTGSVSRSASRSRKRSSR